MRIVFIYSLTDPRDGLIKYIGKTNQKDPKARYNQHIFQWKRDKGKHSRLNSWIKHLVINGLKPEMIIEDQCSEDNWKDYERGYIALMKACGANLKNSTNGGDETPTGCNSPEAKSKRLKTLETSQAWKERGPKHSTKMKELHAAGKIKFGYAHLSDEKRAEMAKNQAEVMRIKFKNTDQGKRIREGRIKAVDLVNATGSILATFESTIAAAKFIGSKDPTNVVKVCKGKAKMTKGFIFQYAQKERSQL